MRNGGPVAMTVYVNGYLCTYDRGTQSPAVSTHNYVGSSTCVMPLSAGTHDVKVGDAYSKHTFAYVLGL